MAGGGRRRFRPADSRIPGGDIVSDGVAAAGGGRARNRTKPAASVPWAAERGTRAEWDGPARDRRGNRRGGVDFGPARLHAVVGEACFGTGDYGAQRFLCAAGWR